MYLGGSLVVNSINGKYEVILNNLKYSGVIYVKLLSIDNENIINEALDFARKYNPKEIYINSSCDYSSKAYSINLYSIICSDYKCDKEIKIKPVTLDKRDDFLEILNSRIKEISGGIIFDNLDLMNIIRNNNGFFIYYKRQLAGLFIKNEDLIDLFVIKKDLEGQGIGFKALSKYLNGIDGIVKLKCASDNERMISILKKLKILKEELDSVWYKVV